MPNLPISALPAAVPLTGPEPAPIVQAGVTRRATVAAIAGTAPFIAAGTVAARSAAARFGEFLNVRDFGAVGDGVADDSAAFAAADAAGGVFAPPGVYRIATALTLANSLLLYDSAHLTIDGVTLTLNGSFECGARLAFDAIAGGLVILNPAVTAFARPEWWGATPQAFTDCFAAITAALAAHGIVAFQSAPYLITQTLILDQSNQALIGTRNIFVSPDQESCTRIIMASASQTIIQLGPTVFPGSINACPFGQHLENFLAQRDRAPDGNANATAIRVGYCVQSTARQVRVQDSIIGWQFRGSVAFIGRELFSSRDIAAAVGPDRFFAFYADGNDLSLGSAGGNASLRLYNLSASGTTLVPDCRAFAADHFFSDLFVYDLESVGCPVGIDIVGVAGSTTPEAVGNTDTLFFHPVLDGYTTTGIRISTLNESGSIEIVTPYTAPAVGATGPAISITDCAGRVHIIGGQIPMLFGAATNGVEITNSAGVTIDGTKFLECGGAAVHGFNANQCVLRPQTSNFINTLHAAVQFATGSNGNIVAAAITGGAGLASFGYVEDDASSNFNEFNCTGLRSTVIAGGAGNKLVSNGVQILVTGPFTFNNLASGVMA
jgi:Pectate lyase superfamily protein